MRTTVTLDDDVATAVKSAARERGVSFKEALNSAIRAGLRPTGRRHSYRMTARPLDLRPDTDLTKALQLAAGLEDEELVYRLDHGR